MNIQKILFVTVMTGLTVVSFAAQAQTHYYYLPLRHLDIQGQWPDSQKPEQRLQWSDRRYLKYYLPYVVGSDREEIYVDFVHNQGDRPGPLSLNRIGSVTQLLNCSFVAIKTDGDIPPAGKVYLPKPDLSGMMAVKFTVSKEKLNDEQESAKQKFYTAMKNHYDFLRTNGFTGTAWFRYRADQARQALEKDKPLDPNEVQEIPQVAGPDEFEESMALFTGQRALSENIQLDRTLQVYLQEPRTIDISTVPGITTAQIDWKAQLKDVQVEKDPLARYIPADQHAILYPTFKSMMYLMDEVKSGKDMLMMNIAVQGIEQYEQQMCVWLDDWSRFWGPKTIHGVAFTGSDPYMQTGTDSAVLFDASMTGLVYSNTESKQEKALEKIKDAKKLTGSVEGVDYQAVVSPDRAVCSYLAKIDNVVVVTNSLAQLKKIVRTAKSQEQSIADLDEYTFFRNRYPADKKEQTTFMVLTDAAIRRWCGPAWRVGAARRTAAAAILSHLQSQYIDEADKFDLNEAQKTAQGWASDIGTISITEAGVTSSVYGNLRFMTPIVELGIDKISERENEQYRRFRQNYQRHWQMFFDPVAVSLHLEDDKIDADLSVRPLILASTYRPYIQIAGNNAIEAADGDIHPQTLLQLILAIDTNSEVMRQMGGFAMQMMQQDINALSWLGRWITIYADDDPFWQELAQKVTDTNFNSEAENYMESNINRLPLALAMEVQSPAKLTLFLVSLRAFIQQTAPNMTAWENLLHDEQAYVKVTARFSEDSDVAIYYAILPDSLILSFHEDLIKQAIERGQLRAKGKDNKPQPAGQWLGKNVCARANEKAWPVIEMLVHDSYSRLLQTQSWNNLPILNEWHIRKGQLSEAEFQLRYWYTPLACPAGGDYVWNPEYATVESAVFGHPGSPKMPETLSTPLTKIKDAQLGITFEEDGLRAKTMIERED